ncbi:MAG: SLC13 family permease, partial [Pseudomonadota bacterium]
MDLPDTDKSGELVDKATRLQQDALFADVSGNQLARLLGTLQSVEFAAGEQIYARESPAKFLYLIESGELYLTTPEGREIVLAGRRCGEEAASDVAAYLCSATASTAVTAIRIPRDALAELAAGAPALRSQALLALMAYVGGEQFHKPAAVKKKPAKALSLSEKIGWLGVIIVPPAIYFLGSMAGLAVEAALFLAILSATVLMWLFGLADEFVPPLVAIAAVLIVGLVPYEVALAGFSSRTLTTLLGVYALAAVMSASGLSYRFMLWLLIRLPDTPFWHQTALLLSGYILSPIMPSGNARLSLVLPFYRDMIDGLDLPAQSKAATALMAATFSGAMLFSPMLLTSKSSNLTVFGMLPTQLQDEFQGLFWFVAAGVAALTVTLVHLLVSRLCFGHDTTVARLALPKARLERQLALLGPVSNPEKAALTGFLFFLIGAGTAGVHQISPAWIAAFLLVGLLLMGLVSKKDFQQKIDWPMIFFLLSLDGLSRAISYLGLDTALARSAGNVFDFVGGEVLLFIPVALVVTLLLRLVLPITAGMVVAAVILIPIAQAQFIHPWVVVFLTAMFSDIWFMPYQSSQYLQVMGRGLDRYYSHGDFLRYNHWMNLSRLAAAYLSIPYW